MLGLGAGFQKCVGNSHLLLARWIRRAALLFVFGIGYWGLTVEPANAISLSASSTLYSVSPANYDTWDGSTSVNNVWFGYVATTTQLVCAFQLPVSRSTASTPQNHQMVALGYFIHGTSTIPSSAGWSEVADAGDAFQSVFLPVSTTPSNDSYTFYLRPDNSYQYSTCVTMSYGDVMWVRVKDDSGIAGTPDAFRVGKVLAGSDQYNYWCYGGNTPAATTCQNGKGAFRVLSDTAAPDWHDYFTFSTSTNPYSVYDQYSSSSYGFTDPDFGWFGNALVDVLKFLFVAPVDAIVNWWQSQMATAMYRVPGGYIVRFQEAWNSHMSGAASSTQPLNLHFNFSKTGVAPFNLASMRSVDGTSSTIDVATVFSGSTSNTAGVRDLSSKIFAWIFWIYVVGRGITFIKELKA